MRHVSGVYRVPFLVLWLGILVPSTLAGQELPATFEIIYREPSPMSPELRFFPEQARAALRYATDHILGPLISSPVPIRIEASWVDLGGTDDLAATGGPAGVVSDSSRSTLYPLALADAISGQDQTPGEFDMVLQFDSSADWYDGIDGNVGPGQVDLVTVALHELLHGLGFVGSTRIGSADPESPACGEGLGCWGWSLNDSQTLPTIFDRFATDASGKLLIEFANPSPELAQVLTEAVFFDHEYVREALNGFPARLWTPGKWDSNSSYSHLDLNEFAPPNQNSLMRPDQPRGVAQHHPGPVTLAILEALGYRIRHNDHFRKRFRLTGEGGLESGNNRYCTHQPGEPAHSLDGTVGGKSIWWEWVAPASGTLTLSTEGSEFDTLLAVYQGTTISTLTHLEREDTPGGTEELIVVVVGGQSYQIAVDGSAGDEGNVILSWSFGLGMADLNVTLEDSLDPAMAGTPLTYTARIGNSGPGIATEVRLFDTLPSSVEYLSVEPSHRCQQSEGIVSCVFPTLGPGESIEVLLTVAPNKAGTLTNEVHVTALENEPQAEDNSSEATTQVQFPPNCSAVDATPTVYSTATGGRWRDPATWAGGRVPESGDRVVLHGPIRLDASAEIAGLLIASGGALQEDTFSPTLTVRGDVTNRGAISSARYDRTFTVSITGNMVNEGQIGPSGNVGLIVSGCISNDGVWTGARTTLSGTNSRFILGASPIGGSVTIAEGFQILGSATLTADVAFGSPAAALTVNFPHTVTIGGITGGSLLGTGTVRVLGHQNGGLTGDLNEIRFGGGNSSLVRGTVQLPRVVFEEPGSRVLDATVTGAVTILSGAILQDSGNRSTHSLTILGDLTNHGTISDSASQLSLYVTVNGNVINHGTILNNSISVSGDIINPGNWQPRSTGLFGSGLRRIGPNALAGDVQILGDVEVSGAATFAGTMYFPNGSLTVNAPHTVTIGGISGGILHGTGAVRILGYQSGGLTGDIHEIRFGGGSSGLVQGTIQLPKVVFEEPGSRIRNATITGAVTILTGAVLGDLGNNDTYSLTIYGDLTNHGTVTQGGQSSRINVTVWGTVVNQGAIHGAVRMMIAGDLRNLGTWTSSRGTFLLWSPVEGSTGYELELSPSVESWPGPLMVGSTSYDVSALVSSTRFWRVRAAFGENRGEWSEVHAINRTLLLLVSPSTPETYDGSDSVDLTWTSDAIPPSDLVTLSMKRDSATHISEPDGIHWIRLAELTPNDGNEGINLPKEAAAGDDWRFFIRHAETGVHDATDFTFTITELPLPSPCSNGALCFYTATPCRVINTRQAGQGPILLSGEVRKIVVAGQCGVPTTARAVSANITAVAATGTGHIRMYPGDLPIPTVSSINFAAGQTRANNAILSLSGDGEGTVATYPVIAGGGQVHLILDINGYFQ